MEENNIYDSYTQKSRIFCYTVLGIKRGASYIPEETYMAWKGEYSYEDCRLVVHYKKCNGSFFAAYSKGILEKCALFEKYVEINKDERVYIFDFTPHKENWMKILDGKYSQLKHTYKKAIETFYWKDYHQRKTVSKLIYPLQHYAEFAGYVGVDPELVREVGEVYDKPDLEKEEFRPIVESKKYFI